MPTYEYRCKDCGHTFDVYQSFTDEALTDCPQCGGALRKLFGNVGISFKGSGFYKTDNRSSSSARDGGAPREAPAKSAKGSGDSSGNGSGSGSSDSKSDSPKSGSPKSGSSKSSSSGSTSSSSSTAST